MSAGTVEILYRKTDIVEIYGKTGARVCAGTSHAHAHANAHGHAHGHEHAHSETNKFKNIKAVEGNDVC